VISSAFWDEEFAEEVERIFRERVAPAVRRIEQAVEENNSLRELSFRFGPPMAVGGASSLRARLWAADRYSLASLYLPRVSRRVPTKEWLAIGPGVGRRKATSSTSTTVRVNCSRGLSDDGYLGGPPLRRSYFACKTPDHRSGAEGIRTPDLRRAKAALSQLSYGPETTLSVRSAPPHFNAPAKSRNESLQAVE
jgi:hypothetical protein